MQEDNRPWLTATYNPEQKKRYFEHRDDYKDVPSDKLYDNLVPEEISFRIIKETLDKRNHPNGISTEEQKNMPLAYYEPDSCPWCGGSLTKEDGTYHCYVCGYDHNLERNDYVWDDEGEED